MIGYHPEVILAGRRINDGMAKFNAEQTIKNMIAAGNYVKGARVNVLGLTFKENCGVSGLLTTPYRDRKCAARIASAI